MYITVLPVVAGYLLPVVEFLIKKQVSCVVGINNELNLFISYNLSLDSIWTHHVISMT